MDDSGQQSVGRYRWVICALLFFATTINYVDRAYSACSSRTLQKVVGWTATQFGDINRAFNLAYAIGFLFAGWMIDKIGTRLGIHDFADRLVVGRRGACVCAHRVGDSPRPDSHSASANRAISRPRSRPSPNGFPRRSGHLPRASSMPARIRRNPRAVASCRFCMRMDGVGSAAFIATGLAGLFWVFFWWPIYRRPQEHPQLSAAGASVHRKRSARSARQNLAGSSCCHFARLGHLPSASF